MLYLERQQQGWTSVLSHTSNNASACDNDVTPQMAIIKHITVDSYIPSQLFILVQYQIINDNVFCAFSFYVRSVWFL